MEPLDLKRFQRVEVNAWARDYLRERATAKFRGLAGVLGRAIEMLQSWADKDQRPDRT